MIAAATALQFLSAQPSQADVNECRAMMVKLDQHVRKYMAFGGPSPLEVPFRELSKTAAQLLCYAMKRHKWVVNANLMAQEARVRGGQPEPHHWLLQLQPMPEVYDAALPETLTVASEDSPLSA